MDLRQRPMKSRSVIMDKALARLCAGFEPAAPAGIGAVKITRIFAQQNAPRWCARRGRQLK